MFPDEFEPGWDRRGGTRMQNSVGFFPDWFRPERVWRDWAGLPPGELSTSREWRGRVWLYKTGPVGWIVSVRSNSDWVTPLRISPQTCMELSLLGGSLSSATSTESPRHDLWRPVDCRTWIRRVLLTLLTPVRRRTCSPVGGFPEGRTALGEGTEHLRAGGWTDTPTSESGAGVRSPAILKNIRLITLTVYIYMYVLYIMCGLSAFSGEVYSLLR